MATTNSLLFKKVSGHIGKQIIFKQYGDTTVISAFPRIKRKRKRTPKQEEINERMGGANYFAKGIIDNPKLRDAAQIRLNVTRNKLYIALVSEYFRNEKTKGGNWIDELIKKETSGS